MYGVRLKQKRGDDAEIPAASAKGPEQVAILVGAGDDHGPVREDDIGRKKIVNGQTILAREMSHSAAESQSSDASGGDDARRNRKPEWVRGVVHVGPGATAANAHGPGRRVYVDVPD